MKQFKHLLTAAMMAFAVTACDEGTGGGTDLVTGTVSGAVTVEGAGQGGVTVSLSGSSDGAPISNTTTTDGSGNYSFPNVPGGTYVVSITPPEGTTFAQTSQAVSITASAPGATASFAGEFIRTSAISGTVTSGQGPLEGVQVQLSGDETASTSTDASGGYSFTGLRAGSYTVTITPPAGTNFDVTSQSVTLGTGDAQVVSFAGELPSTASVAIKSITTGTTNTPVNPANVMGQIDVTLTVDEGNDNVESVQLFVDGEEVGRQDFASNVPGEEPAEVAVFDVVFPILTANFDPADGTPDFLNGDHEVTASINTSAGGESSASTSQTLTFNNADALFGEITFETGPVISEFAGRPFTGGDHTITIWGVSYSGGNITTVTVNWPGVGAEGATGGSPFTIVYAADDQIMDYQTDLATGTVVDVITVTAASYDDGTPVTGAPGTVIPGPVDPAGVLADNLAPLPGMLVLPEQDLDDPCCFNSWTNAAYTWATGHGLAAAGGAGVAPDDGTGVGNIVASWHPGDAALDDDELAALDASDDASGLDESGNNQAYSVVALVADGLGNAADPLRLAANGSNAFTTFGIDNTAPTAAYTMGSPADMTIFSTPAGNAVPQTFDVALTDAGATASGFGPNAQRSRAYGGFSTATMGVGSGTNCLYGTDVDDVCEVALTPAGGDVFNPATPADDNYWTDHRFAYDAAGNMTNELSATVLSDFTVPTVSNIAIPPTLTGGAPATFTADAEDNVDLYKNQPSMSFVGFGSYWQFSEGQMFGPGFVNPPITDATISETFNFVASIQDNALNPPGSAFDIRFVVNDVAMNQSIQSNQFAVGTVPPPVDFTATGTTGSALVEPAAAVNVCNGLGAAACPAGDLTGTVDIEYNTTGPTGTFAFPCQAGVLLFEENTTAVPSVFDLIGTFPAPTVTDDGVTRTWTTTFTLDLTGRAAEANIPLRGVCMSADGGAWITLENNNVTITDGTF